MTDFFISYTGADRTWAEWIAWVLEASGSSVTIQAWDFRPGGNFVVDMHKAAVDSERTLAVLSPDYLKSLYSTAEWAAAFAQDPTGEKGKLLPVRVREVEPDGLLAQIVYVDLVGLEEPAARERLLAGLARGRAKPAVQPGFPSGSAGRLFPGEVPAALSKPAAISEDRIPEPGALPAGSRMPLSLNPLFVGRREDLRALAERLEIGEAPAAGRVVVAAAATGLGGVGKTQVACELVHRYGRAFSGGVYWVSFGKPDAVPAEVAACGLSLDLHPSYEALPLEQQVRLVEEAWNRPIPRLLIFDDCEEDELLDRWRPRFGGARVLVTSRRSGWDPVLGVREVRLGMLPRAASVDLLHRFRPELAEDDPALDAIALEVGDLPLALHLAGSFLARYARSPFGQPAAYLDALRRGGLLDHPSLQGRAAGISPTGHEARVARTFALSFERLDPLDPIDALAITLLARAAWFAAGEPIPRSLLLATIDLDPDDPEAAFQSEDALARLAGLGLLETGEEGSLIVHRLVAIFARGIAGAEAAQAAVEEAVIRAADRVNQSGLPGPLLAWQPHLRAVVEKARERGDERTARLGNELGFHLFAVGDLAGARVQLEEALAIREAVLGPEHLDTALSLNNLGGLLDLQGDSAGARTCYERALATHEAALGPDHSETARVLNNLGQLVKNQGDLAGARAYFERALAIDEKALGPDHPETAIVLRNLGLLLDESGEQEAARSCLERALAIQEKVQGPEHPDTARTLIDLGYHFLGQGDLTAARLFLERGLAIFETALGPEHPETALALNNLGGLLHGQGDLTGAVACYERALAILEKLLGPDHPDTALGLNNLGGVREAQGDLAAARACYSRALEVFEASLGPEHPYTETVRANLGRLGEA